MVNPTDHMLHLLRSSKCYRLDIDITADGFKLFWHYFDNAVSTNSLKLMTLDTFDDHMTLMSLITFDQKQSHRVLINKSGHVFD